MSDKRIYLLVTSAINEAGEDKNQLIKNLTALVQAQESEAHENGFFDALEFIEYEGGEYTELYELWERGMSIDELDILNEEFELNYTDLDEFEDEE